MSSGEQQPASVREVRRWPRFGLRRARLGTIFGGQPYIHHCRFQMSSDCHHTQTKRENAAEPLLQHAVVAVLAMVAILSPKLGIL